MQKKLREFAAGLGLALTDKSVILLLQYADLVWEKKDTLNLTSVANKQEIITRHICDGLAGAAWVAGQGFDKADFTLADAGSGAGYIGLTIAISLPHVRVHLIESLQRRSMFLQWVVMKLGLQNVVVENIRLGQNSTLQFDAITERAMGQLKDILPILASSVKPGGLVGAYQSSLDGADSDMLASLHLTQAKPVAYTLPGEEKERYISVFKK